MFPSNGLTIRRPASLRRVQNGASSPVSSVLSGRYDFPPFISPRFVSFAWPIPLKRSVFFLSAHGRAQPRGSLGVGRPVSPAGIWSVETAGPPAFLGNPDCALALLSDPGGTDTSGLGDASARPPQCPRRRLPRYILSRLNHTASALAVYASQAGSPRHHARLASGCWLNSPGRA